MTYPEKIPSNPKTSFNFSFSKVDKNENNISNNLSTINERINKIISSPQFCIKEVPVLQHICALSPTKSELKKIAKACERLADLIQIQQDLSAKMSVIQIAKQDPHWLTLNFGDFQEEIDKDIDLLFTKED